MNVVYELEQIKIQVHVYLPKSYGQRSLVPMTESSPKI